MKPETLKDEANSSPNLGAARKISHFSMTKFENSDRKMTSSGFEGRVSGETNTGAVNFPLVSQNIDFNQYNGNWFGALNYMAAAQN